MKKFLLGIMTMFVLSIIVGCSSNEGATNQEGAEGDSDTDATETITFGVTPWTSTVPPTKIASLILQDMGYEVAETKADAGNVYIGLSRGDIDVFMDAWLPVHEVYLDKYADNIHNTAVSYDNAEAGWVVPSYMEDINTMSDLKGKEDLFKNEMYAIEKGASATEVINDAIAGYELDLTQINSSEGGMIAQAMKKMAQEEPVIFYGWRPHTMFNKFDIKVLEDNKGFFESASVSVITNNDLKERAPEAYEFLANWSISIDDVEAMIAKIEDEGQDPEQVAREWIDNNQDKVNEMLGK
ncbi:glycine betaine/proline transport system substrate-binding protein [Mesobacillus persicus]|uniref:Glycine betaine/proline transport system substrate-binding protein n=1 Tax=Mesobacillus persicus TaxID=930146 RepID=A0A1H8G2R5_9BACI|nr:glycine betaine ABC transporter substrate-binding protein [Mesobacillus persicus]SEN38189.1 glycine betaine/proline transport system substrate-binding protein [Mesobacillus persicus]